MNKKILLTLISLIAVAFLAFSSTVQAAPVTIATYNLASIAGPGSISVDYPSTDMSFVGARGQAFTATATGYVTSVTVYMENFGAVGGNMYMDLVTIAAGVPTGTLQTSSQKAITTLSSSGYTAITFTFGGTIQLTSGQTYGFYITGLGVDYTGNTYFAIGQSDVSVYGGGAMFYQQNNAWATLDAKDCNFTVTGETVGPTPTPTPTATPPADGDTFWNTGIGAQIFAFIPTLTSLIVVLLAAFLGWKFAGPWGFFAGINLGYIISVALNILPLWGMIALLVIDGLLLFGKVGFHN